MSTTLLIIGAISFIITFGIHAIIKTESNFFDEPLYLSSPILSSIPWISGFILPVIAWSYVINIHWVALFFINLAVVYVLGPWLTRGFIARFASEEGLGKDVVISFVIGLITLVIGLILK